MFFTKKIDGDWIQADAGAQTGIIVLFDGKELAADEYRNGTHRVIGQMDGKAKNDNRLLIYLKQEKAQSDYKKMAVKVLPNRIKDASGNWCVAETRVCDTNQRYGEGDHDPYPYYIGP